MKLLTVILLVLVHFPAMAEPETEVNLVKETTRVILEQLHFERDKLENEPEYIRHLVRDLITPQFDFNLMSQLVLGQYWRELNSENRACFVDGFRDMLVERYAYILLSFDNHQISYEPAYDIGEQGNRLVRQTISREGMAPLPVEYAMQKNGDEWKVVDLIVDRVSLVRNYRGIFQSLIHTQGIGYFIQTFPGCLD